MNYDIFKTEDDLLFLACVNSSDSQLGFSFEEMPICQEEILNDDLWRICENPRSGVITKQHESKYIIANILSVDVASKTRRGVANILIVPSMEDKEYFDSFDSAPHNTRKIIVDSSLKPNELRATYWNIRSNKEGKQIIVDGGIQISPKGVSVISNIKNVVIDYRAYFVRTFYE